MMQIRVHKWVIGKYHRRCDSCLESCNSGSFPDNCAPAAGPATDSAGIDCGGSPSTVNVGHARDPISPGPMFFSQAEFQATTADSPFPAGNPAGSKTVTLCVHDFPTVFECRRPLRTNYETHTLLLSGETVCHQESAQMSIMLPASASRAKALVPLAWKKDYYCVRGDQLLYHNHIKRVEEVVMESGLIQVYAYDWGILNPVHGLVWYPLWGFIGLRTYKKLDDSNPYSDKICV